MSGFTISLVIALLENPKEEWRMSDMGYVWEHPKSGIAIWVSNMPIFDTGIYKPNNFPCSIWSRWKLWRAVKKSQANQINLAIMNYDQKTKS